MTSTPAKSSPVTWSACVLITWTAAYINMEIISTQVSISPDKKQVFITVNINEGEKYTVRDVSLRGDLKIPEEQIKALLLVQKGQVFSRTLMTPRTL